jgi:hypothetical protein
LVGYIAQNGGLSDSPKTGRSAELPAVGEYVRDTKRKIKNAGEGENSKQHFSDFEKQGALVLTKQSFSIVANPEKIFFGQNARKGTFMKKFVISLLLVLLLLLPMPGCNEQQKQQIDKAADVVENVTQGGQAILDSPAGGLVPSEIRLMLEAGGALAMGLVIAWREWRKKQLQTALDQVVTGNEIAKDKSEDVNTAIKEAQTVTQSAKTTELVAKIRAA